MLWPPVRGTHWKDGWVRRCSRMNLRKQRTSSTDSQTPMAAGRTFSKFA
ncbi:hypothetical protein ACLESO_27600 [Pyxidicoccus sp. 3LG]